MKFVAGSWSGAVATVDRHSGVFTWQPTEGEFSTIATNGDQPAAPLEKLAWPAMVTGQATAWSRVEHSPNPVVTTAEASEAAGARQLFAVWRGVEMPTPRIDAHFPPAASHGDKRDEGIPEIERVWETELDGAIEAITDDLGRQHRN